MLEAPRVVGLAEQAGQVGAPLVGALQAVHQAGRLELAIAAARRAAASWPGASFT